MGSVRPILAALLGLRSCAQPGAHAWFPPWALRLPQVLAAMSGGGSTLPSLGMGLQEAVGGCEAPAPTEQPDAAGGVGLPRCSRPGWVIPRYKDHNGLLLCVGMCLDPVASAVLSAPSTCCGVARIGASQPPAALLWPSGASAELTHVGVRCAGSGPGGGQRVGKGCGAHSL